MLLRLGSLRGCLCGVPCVCVLRAERRAVFADLAFADFQAHTPCFAALLRLLTNLALRARAVLSCADWRFHSTRAPQRTPRMSSSNSTPRPAKQPLRPRAVSPARLLFFGDDEPAVAVPTPRHPHHPTTSTTTTIATDTHPTYTEELRLGRSCSADLAWLMMGPPPAKCAAVWCKGSSSPVRHAVSPVLPAPPLLLPDPLQPTRVPGALLPTVAGARASAFPCVSVATAAALLDGTLAVPEGRRLLVVDCRYPFEYHGGHIRTAVNVSGAGADAEQQLRALLYPEDAPLRAVLLFHCEFSQARGPRMMALLRELDRERNEERYPRLDYDQMYLIHGGYKQFHAERPDLCEPHGAYVPMLHPRHAAELAVCCAQRHRARSRRHTRTRVAAATASAPPAQEATTRTPGAVMSSAASSSSSSTNSNRSHSLEPPDAPAPLERQGRSSSMPLQQHSTTSTDTTDSNSSGRYGLGVQP